MAISWARFDDNYDSNPKVFAAGLHGKSLHESSIRWCCRQRTGGMIPKDALGLVATLAQLPASKSVRRRAAERLVELNLWEDRGEAWAVHDYEEYSAPKRFIGHAERGENHALRDPIPDPVPVPSHVSLKDLRDRAIGRGVAEDAIDDRLAALQRWVEAKGARHWIPYVLRGYQGGAPLFDQQVTRWLEEDHLARRKEEQDNPFVTELRLKRMGEA